MNHKTIHQVWVGEADIPDEELAFAETFRKKCPDWMLLLWTDNPDKFKDGPWHDRHAPPESHLGQCFKVIRERTDPKILPALMSDIIRLDVLTLFGGVYMDTDIYCVKDITPLFARPKLALAHEYMNNAVGNCMIAAEREHPALYTCMNNIYFKIQAVVIRGGRMEPVPITGPHPVRESLSSHPDCVVFPYEVFSPWNPFYVLPDMDSVKWSKRTYAVHGFASKWTTLDRSTDLEGAGLVPTWR